MERLEVGRQKSRGNRLACGHVEEDLTGLVYAADADRPDIRPTRFVEEVLHQLEAASWVEVEVPVGTSLAEKQADDLAPAVESLHERLS